MDIARLIHALQPYPKILSLVLGMMTDEDFERYVGLAVRFPGDVPDTHHQASLAAAHYHVQPGPRGVGI